MNFIFQVASVWFGKLPRKPPEKCVAIVLLDYFYEHFPRFSYFIWSLLHPLGRKESTISFGRESHTWVPSISKKSTTVPKHFLGVRSRNRYRRLRLATSLVLLSRPALQFATDDYFQFITKSYNFVLDTGSSDHVCRDRELFLEDPTPCPHISLQGVGGKVQTSGIGTIKIRVRDDDNALHDLFIPNVLYVPECPINLLSPQHLSSVDPNSNVNDAGILTLNNTTIFFWEKMTFSCTIFHQAGAGIPILHVHEDFSSDTLLPTACHLCNTTAPSYLQTSAPHIVDGDDEAPHIIPNDEGNNEGNNIDLADIQVASESSTVHVIPLDDEVDDYPTILSSDNLLFDQADEDFGNDLATSIPAAAAEHPSGPPLLHGDHFEAELLLEMILP